MNYMDAPTISVLLFARVREVFAQDSVSLDWSRGGTIGDVRSALSSLRPNVADLLIRCAIALNGEYVSDDRGVSSGDEIAVIPPVSGGQRRIRRMAEW